VVRPGEAEYLKGEHLSTVVARIPEGDMQANLPEGDKLLAQPNPNPLKVSRYMRLRPLPSSMRALVSRVVPISGQTMRANLPGFGTQSG
jgi:hypothetical protein